jgi:hypothetical protein
MRRGKNGWLFAFMVRPTEMPYRVDKLITGRKGRLSRWRVMGWFAERDQAISASVNGFGGTCRVVEVDRHDYREEWRAVA